MPFLSRIHKLARKPHKSANSRRVTLSPWQSTSLCLRCEVLSCWEELLNPSRMHRDTQATERARLGLCQKSGSNIAPAKPHPEPADVRSSRQQAFMISSTGTARSNCEIDTKEGAEAGLRTVQGAVLHFPSWPRKHSGRVPPAPRPRAASQPYRHFRQQGSNRPAQACP